MKNFFPVAYFGLFGLGSSVFGLSSGNGQYIQKGQALLDSARELGLPPGPLQAKIKEGQAKGKSPNQIYNALKWRFANLKKVALGFKI